MLKKVAIKINSVSVGLEDEKFVVKIKVNNPKDRTLYAYGSPRRIFYDNASGKLTLELHDRNLPDEDQQVELHLKEPRFVPLEGGTESEIKIKLVPLMRRLRPSVERGNGALFEELRVSEAKEVEVEIAHQDTPFYYNPKLSNVKQLKEWGKTVSKAKFKITPLKTKKDSEPKPKSHK